MDPPPEGCPLCGSTWGDWWQEVQGRSTYFCCKLCAQEWVLLLEEIGRRTAWPNLDAVRVDGNRWGRTGEAQHAGASFRFAVAFTPEGRLRRFEALPVSVAPPPDMPALATPEPPVEVLSTPPPEPIEAVAPSEAIETAADHEDPPAPAFADLIPTDESAQPPAELPPPEAAPLPPTPPRSAEFHPEIRAQLEHEAGTYPDLTSLSPEEGRKIARQMSRETDGYIGTAPAVSQLKTTSFGPSGHRVPVRVYTPKDGESPFPVIAYFHGGGWVFGDLDTHDTVCREIANRSQCVVASVGYRRAPEHKFPTAVEDCFAAVRWLSEEAVSARLGTDPARVAVAGDSAGGNMAAVVCLLARERNGPKIAGQVLICPITAYMPLTESYTENAKGYGFETAFMPWMWEQYLTNAEEGKDPRVAPLNATELSGLPPALVITAQYDLLRDEGEAYARRLHDALVPVRATRYPGMPHGFIDYRGLVDEGWEALDEIGSWFRSLFAR
ncbi:MAG: TA0938 family protein [Thermoplasmata archaeon]|nr:TA0938 family protein [Thermoplasmata archaeon]